MATRTAITISWYPRITHTHRLAVCADWSLWTLQTNACDWLIDCRLADCKLMIMAASTDWWLWLTEQANTFCGFSRSLKANLEMVCDYGHFPDSSLNPAIPTYTHCCTFFMSTVCYWHCYTVVFPCRSLLFCSLGMFLENVEICVMMFKGKGLYSLQIICYISLKSLHKTVVQSL
jgi:hypothetical protein